MSGYRFEISPEIFVFHRLEAVPDTIPRGATFAALSAGDVSIMAPEALDVPDSIESEGGWRQLRIVEAFAFTEVGIAAGVTSVLAAAGVSVLVMSGYRHDYFYVAEERLAAARAALSAAGYGFAPAVDQP